jgi:hypothetical protein
MKINFKELEEQEEKNFKERLEFIKFWANYVKTHPDKEWSEQQNIIIDSQLS